MSAPRSRRRKIDTFNMAASCALQSATHFRHEPCCLRLVASRLADLLTSLVLDELPCTVESRPVAA